MNIDIYKFFVDLSSKSSLTDWLTFIVALVALFFAWHQLREARRVREEQAQPYVFIDMRRIKGNIFELYVKNIGSTIAYDVQLKSAPELSSLDDNFWVFDSLPALVPGQEWSTIWESDASSRYQSSLPEAYQVDVVFKDSKGRKYTVPNTLDWRTQWQRVSLISKDIDDLANRLADISKNQRELTREIYRIGLLLGPDEDGKENILESVRGIYRKLPNENNLEDESLV